MQEFELSNYQCRLMALMQQLRGDTDNSQSAPAASLGVWRRETWPGPVSWEQILQLCQSAAQQVEILRTRCALPDTPALVTNRDGKRWDGTGGRQQVAAEPRWQSLQWSAQADHDDALFNRELQQQVATAPDQLWLALRQHGEHHELVMWLPACCGDSQTLALVFQLIRQAWGTAANLVHSGEILQYGDFSAWQRSQEISPTARAYWLRQQPLERRQLPLGHNVEAQAGWQPAWYELMSGNQALHAALLNADEASLISLWAAFLARCSGLGEFTLAIRRDGRMEAELADCLGPLTQYLPLTLNVDDGNYQLLCQQTRERLAPLERWQQEFHWGLVDPAWRGRSLSCAFALFDRAAADSGDSSWAGADSRDQDMLQPQWGEALEPHALALEVYRQRSRQHLLLRLRYDAGRYSLAEIRELVQQWQVFAAATLSLPQQALRHLPLLDELGRRQLLRAARGGEPGWAAATVPELLGAGADDALALIEGERQWTYGELRQQVAQLARYLQSLGLGPREMLGICLPRSAAQIIAMLAAHCCGAAYVPLDPANPPLRLNQLIDDAGCSLVITAQAVLGPLLEADCAAELVVWERDQEEIQAQSGSWPAHAGSEFDLSPDCTAYLIYTSGSSGRPKGVKVSHANICHYARAVMERLQLPAAASMAALATVAADLAYTSVYGALLTGRSLRILPESLNLDRAALAEELRLRPLGALKIVPSHLCALVQDMHEPADADWLPPYIIFGGEALPAELCQRLWQLRPDLSLFNHYGPTETTVGVVCAAVKRTRRHGTVALGQALSGTLCYVLDEEMRLVAPGGSGELYLGGLGVSQGYWQRDLETQQAFISNPYQSQEPAALRSARLYRSGDRVRLGLAGEISFLGRCDDQVKIRGQRVEPDEVAAQLRQCPGVECAVVLAVEGQLRAYLSGPREQRSDAAQLQHWLGQRLPAVYCPSHWRWCDTLPLTANGKIDRKALLQLPEESQQLAQGQAAQSEEEAQLMQLWQQLLRREVGREDHFFQLGGDSILAIQLVARARQQGLVITPQQVFAHPQLFELAAVAGRCAVVAAEQGQVTGEVLLTPSQCEFLRQGSAQAGHYFRSRVLTLTQALDVELLSQSVDYLLRRHDALRLRFRQGSDGRWQQWAEHSNQLALHDTLWVRPGDSLVGADTQQQLLALQEELARAVNLERGPLFRVVYVTATEQAPAYLVLAAHRLVIDGVSWRILVQDLVQAYQSLSQRGEVPQTLKTSSYRQWSRSLRQGDGVEELNPAATPATTSSVKGVDPFPAALAQRLGRPCNALGQLDCGMEVETRRCQSRLSPAQTQRLLDLAAAARAADGQQSAANESGAGVEACLLSAFAQVVAQWCGVSGSWVDVESHGRDHDFKHIDISQTVGFFAYPRALALPDQPSPLALRQALERLNEGQRPGGSARLRGERPQLFFTYLGQFDQALPENPWFRASDHWLPPLRWGADARSYVLECHQGIADGRLQVELVYSSQLLSAAQAEALLDQYLDSLGEWLASVSAESGAAGQAVQTAGVGQIIQRPLPAFLQAFFSHSQAQPNAPVYKVQNAFAWEGPAAAPALRLAWQALVQRHAALGLSVRDLNHDPAQLLINPQAPVPWFEHDWQALSAEQQEDEFQALLAATLVQDFDLERAPLMQLHWVQMGQQQQRLLWVYHHGIGDGWSAAVLWRELLQLYPLARGMLGQLPEAALTSWQATPRVPAAAELPSEWYGAAQTLAQSLPKASSYLDFLNWREHQQQGTAHQAALDYWQALGQIEQAQPSFTGVPLATAAQGKTGTDNAWAEWEALAPAELSAALSQLAQRAGVTEAVLYQAAWALLLARCENQNRVGYGLTVSGRPAQLAGVESLVGLCLSSVPMRLQLDPQQPLMSFLQNLQQQQQQASEFSLLPRRELAQVLGVAANAALFETLLVVENLPQAMHYQEQTASGQAPVQLTRLNASSYNHYPLTLMLVSGPRLYLKMKYQRSRLRQQQVDFLAQSFFSLLQQLSQGAQQKLGQLHWLSLTQRYQLLQRAQGPQASWGVAELPQLVRQWAQQRPTALALTQGEEGWNYAQLWSGISQRAHALRQLDVGPGDRVLLCLPRSAELVFQLLAVQSRGAIAVPLEPSAPAAQLQRIVDDAQAQLIIAAQASLETLLSLEQDAELLVVERDQADWAEAPKDIEPISLGGAGTAYLIYTSGSTGQPKGVAVSQANLSHYARAVMERLDLPADASLGALATVAADLGYTALYGALASGRSLRILPESLNLDAQALATELRQRPLDALKLTPSHLQALVQASAALDWLPKTLICGGEALSPALVQQIQAQRPDCRVFNHYGPSETTVGVLCGEVVSKSLQPDLSAPLGTPLAGCSAYVLDQALNPVAPGGLGELYLGGAGVSQGYWGRARETAERFIPHPWAAGERLYRSGDQVRVDEQGQLHFQGRGDGQVKVRGHRVELAALGWQLEQLEAIRQAVVLLEQGQLRAYLVGEEQDLSGWFNQHWPEYQHPQQVHWLQALPLTANGKLDRAQLRNLPAPGQAGVSSAPRNALEEQLLQLWQGLLGRQDIGRDDAFLALGGDSILVIQLVARAREQGLEFTPQQLYQYQTIAALARLLAEQGGAAAEAGATHLVPVDGAEAEQGRVAFSPIQRRFWRQVQQQRQHYVQSRLLTLPAALNGDALARALKALWCHHDALRLALAPEVDASHAAEAPVQGWDKSLELHFLPAQGGLGDNLLVHDAVNLERLTAEGWQALVDECCAHWHGRLNLGGPLFRAIWLDAGADQAGRLLLFAHHLCVDGYSWRVLEEDLQRLYQQACRGETLRLPARSAGYRQWLASQWTGLGTGLVERPVAASTPTTSRNYWYQQLVEHQRLGDVLAHWHQPGLSEADLMELPQRLDTATSARLLAAAGQLEGGVQTYLLSALALAAGAQGEAPLWLELEAHGRDQGLDLSRTVGWFTQLFPLRLPQPGPGPLRPEDLLQQLQQALAAVPEQGQDYLPLTQVEAGALPALPARVKFNYFGKLNRDPSSESAAGQGFQRASELLGQLHGARQQVEHALVINSAILSEGADGMPSLQLSWRFPRLQLASARTLMHDFLQALQALMPAVPHLPHVMEAAVASNAVGSGAAAVPGDQHRGDSIQHSLVQDAHAAGLNRDDFAQLMDELEELL